MDKVFLQKEINTCNKSTGKPYHGAAGEIVVLTLKKHLHCTDKFIVCFLLLLLQKYLMHCNWWECSEYLITKRNCTAPKISYILNPKKYQQCSNSSRSDSCVTFEKRGQLWSEDNHTSLCHITTFLVSRCVAIKRRPRLQKRTEVGQWILNCSFAGPGL